MRPKAELDFILARTLEHIRTHPPKGALLGEPKPICRRGHTMPERVLGARQRRCAECLKQWREGRG